MSGFSALPKSVKKTIRYIQQDATPEKLEMIRHIVIQSIDKQSYELSRFKLK